MTLRTVLIWQAAIGWAGLSITLYTVTDAWRSYRAWGTGDDPEDAGVRVAARGDLYGEGCRVLAHLFLVVPTTIALVAYAVPEGAVSFSWRIWWFLGITLALTLGSMNSLMTRRKLKALV